MEDAREFQISAEHQIYCFFVESGVFEAEALLSNIAANSNGQIETRQEIFLSSCQNTRYKHLFFHSTVTSFTLI